MKTKKRIVVTSYRHHLSVQYSEPLEPRCIDGPPKLSAGAPAAGLVSPEHIAQISELTMVVKTQVETEIKSGRISYSNFRNLKLFLDQLKSRMNSLCHRQRLILNRQATNRENSHGSANNK